MHDENRALRELVQQLKSDLEQARGVARTLQGDIRSAIDSIEEGNALEASGDLRDALTRSEEITEDWPEESA